MKVWCESVCHKNYFIRNWYRHWVDSSCNRIRIPHKSIQNGDLWGSFLITFEF